MTGVIVGFDLLRSPRVTLCYALPRQLLPTSPFAAGADPVSARHPEVRRRVLGRRKRSGRFRTRSCRFCMRGSALHHGSDLLGEVLLLLAPQRASALLGPLDLTQIARRSPAISRFLPGAKTLGRRIRGGHREEGNGAGAFAPAPVSPVWADQPFTMEAISSAKFSCFFSMPSPFSKRTASLKATLPPSALAAEAIYFSTVMELSLTNSCCSRQFSA